MIPAWTALNVFVDAVGAVAWLGLVGWLLLCALLPVLIKVGRRG